MGSSPRTKADYLRAIERKQAQLVQAQNAVLSMKQTKNKDGIRNWQSKVNELKAEISTLKLKMKQAPKD